MAKQKRYTYKKLKQATATQLIQKYGTPELTKESFYARIRSGWSIERALKEKPKLRGERYNQNLEKQQCLAFRRLNQRWKPCRQV